MYADSKIVTQALREARQWLAQESGYGVQMANDVLDDLEGSYGLYACDKERVFKMREEIAAAGWMCYEKAWEM